ncbi:hypothetical protein QFC24_006284 [Naganishia onofrii]|uniref:Uncharacterized protein n=1 Tax=Naganishia onofrii TaxID=1851511 RepID=A0ACC2X290_9TREE|nr:hypothetical protein QFC24_006284 [Naganishia onofrii]
MTVTVTDSSGQTQESVISSLGSAGSKSGTNVGAIAGGAAGGVVGLLAIIALLWFCVFKKRRRTQEDDLDDALFNAGRGRLAVPGQTDILDDEQPNNDDVDPYTYRDGRSPEMSQYASGGGGYPASMTGTAPSLAPLISGAGAIALSRNGSYSEASQSGAGGGAQGITRGPSTASTLTSSGFAGRAAADGAPQVPANQMPQYSAYYQAASSGAGAGAGTYANASLPSLALAGSAPSAQQQQQQPLTGAQQKAREAALDRPVLRTANPSSSDDYYAPAAAAAAAGTASAGGVYVHSDNGRYVEPEPVAGREEDVLDDGPSELPPQ